MSDEFPKVHDISWGDEDDQFLDPDYNHPIDIKQESSSSELEEGIKG